MKQDLLRRLPSIDQLLARGEAGELIGRYGRGPATDALRSAVDRLRTAIVESGDDDLDVSAEGILGDAAGLLCARYSPSIRHAINATGVILHTGLGRAMLSEGALGQVSDVIRGYSTLAVDPETGQRGSRDVHVSSLLCELTGAEAATLANNNAAATMLILNTLAKGKEVIVSRGQLVEIGGSFRMPDVMEASGAILREVGTTNKTHLRDYAGAINENTGAILKVHQSNYRIMGFTEEPSIHDLVQLARERSLPVIDDLGSGALLDLRKYGLEDEPLVQNSIEAGADVVCFSGDKLIGGPQCGIIVGKAATIQRIKKNQLARALRVGKMTVAALEATLRLFLNPERLEGGHPTYRMLSLTRDELEARANLASRRLAAEAGDAAQVSVVDGESQVGSGSVPTQTLPSRVLSVKPKSVSTDALSRALRYRSPAVVARIHQDALLFDFRTVQPEEDEALVQALVQELRVD